MEQDLEALLGAIENSEDLAACEEIVARNFPGFLENDALQSFPDEVLYGVLTHPAINYPDPDATANFFLRLFDHGPSAVAMFVSLLPADNLSVAGCDLICAKLEELGCEVELKKVTRIRNLQAALESTASTRKETEDQMSATATQLGRSSDILTRMTTLLRNTSDALKVATAVLEQKEAELAKKDELIESLKPKKRGRR
jgi:hypothetical protein